MANQLKGFTILEALIGLMLMSIIIGLIFTTINLIGKQLSLFKKENTEILEYNLFNTVFKNDLHNSRDYKINNNHILFVKYDDTKVRYSIEKPNVIRKKLNVLDTFKIKIIDYNFNNQSKSNQNKLHLKLRLLDETIDANYFFNNSVSKIINTKLF